MSTTISTSNEGVYQDDRGTNVALNWRLSDGSTDQLILVGTDWKSISLYKLPLEPDPDTGYVLA